MNALLVVDVQNDFLPGGALAVPGGDQVIPIVNRLVECFALVLATQDWHPANHGSFAANHPNRRPGEMIDLNGIRQILWPVHCVQGSPGAAFSAQLRTERFSNVFEKELILESIATAAFLIMAENALPAWPSICRTGMSTNSLSAVSRQITASSFPLSIVPVPASAPT
jgi:nicotinamidase-related amidase